MCRKGYRYAELLLLERQQQLKALDLKYGGTPPPLSSDYFSCRRPLLHAINQLETLLGADPEAVAAIHVRELKE